MPAGLRREGEKMEISIDKNSVKSYLSAVKESINKFECRFLRGLYIIECDYIHGVRAKNLMSLSMDELRNLDPVEVRYQDCILTMNTNSNILGYWGSMDDACNQDCATGKEAKVRRLIVRAVEAHAEMRETNSFADPAKSGNGGGYSQPAGGWGRIEYRDSSCGDFGSRECLLLNSLRRENDELEIARNVLAELEALGLPTFGIEIS